MGYNLLINGLYGGYNLPILTFDPNFQQDIQVRPAKKNPYFAFGGYLGGVGEKLP